MSRHRRGSTAGPKGRATSAHVDVLRCCELNWVSNRLDPEDVRDVFAAYRGACLEAIQRYDGYVAKYIGDGFLAFFGYPLAREDAAESSLRAALVLVRPCRN